MHGLCCANFATAKLRSGIAYPSCRTSPAQVDEVARMEPGYTSTTLSVFLPDGRAGYRDGKSNLPKTSCLQNLTPRTPSCFLQDIPGHVVLGLHRSEQANCVRLKINSPRNVCVGTLTLALAMRTCSLSSHSKLHTRQTYTSFHRWHGRRPPRFVT